MTIGVYIRVSSSSQSSASQKAEIRKWLKAHDHNARSVKWFEDTESGKTMERDAFKKLQAAIFNGEVKTVVVWKLDRLARSLKEGIETITDWCEQGVRVVSVTQQIDLSGKVGQMVAAVLFGIADIEHEHIRERQAAGIAEAKKRGVYKGRKAGTTKGDPARAHELRSQGLKVKEIASALGVSVRTANSYLAVEG